MKQHNTIQGTSMEKSAERTFVVPRNDRREEAGGKCAFLSCKDRAWRDHLCWDHYQHEYYTAR